MTRRIFKSSFTSSVSNALSFSSLNAGIPFSIRVLTIAAALFLVLRSITAKSP